MDDPKARRLAHSGRIASSLISFGLIAWAFSDDSLIGGGPGFGWTQTAVLLVGLGLAASCAAPSACNGRILALVLSTGVALCVAEVVLRQLVSARYYRPFELDARVLYRLSPDAVREYRRAAINGGDRIVYRTNSAGFRGEEFDSDRRGARLVLYGDSFIQGEFSILPNTFAERLEYAVAEALGKSVEVVNAGVAGYGPDQIVRRMEDDLGTLEPDLVLVAIYAGNDFGDLLRNKLYRLGTGGDLRKNTPVIAPSLQQEMELRRRELILKMIVREAVAVLRVTFGAESSPTEDLKTMTPEERMEFFLNQHLREYEEYVVKGDNSVRNLAFDTYDADVSLKPSSDAARYKIELMDQLLARMQEIADANRIPLVLVLIPHPIDVAGHDIAAVDRARYPEYEPSGLTDILERIARQRGIDFVNLFGLFRERGGGDLYFRVVDDHWNDRGQDIAAQVVADYLTSGHQLKGGSPRVSQRK